MTTRSDRARGVAIVTAVCVLAGFFLAGQAFAQGKTSSWAYKRFTDATWIYVDKIDYSESDDSYTITKTPGSIKIPRKEMEDLMIPEPDDYSKYATSMKSSSPSSEAVACMESIAARYKHRKWDSAALKLLIPYYLFVKRDAAKAADAFRPFLKAGGVPEDVRLLYWQALLGDNRLPQLRKEVEDAIENGSRASAAAAYLIRGDMYMKEGKAQDALIEGYLRATILFTDVKDLQPEALFKTWQTMKASDPQRADKLFRRRLLQDYPNSKQAQDAQKG